MSSAGALIEVSDEYVHLAYEELIRREFGPLGRPFAQTYGLTLYDEFAGAGGSTSGAASAPYVEPIQAANHHPLALESHGANYPDVDHILGDVLDMDITRFARADIFWASPACPPWTDARGKKRDFDKQTFQTLPGLEEDAPVVDEQTMRARKLMEEVPRYLAHWAQRGKPILVGVVENVIQCRKWSEFNRWINEIKALGYHVKIIAYNSMHAEAPRSRRAPQSRDRMYIAYWLKKFGRNPDWDKWLRPRAYCPSCDSVIQAVQVFKKQGVDMGRYGVKSGQYVYRCPKHSCKGQLVEPLTLPAAAAIDWTIPGTPIGERQEHGKDPLAPATIARIRAGLRKYSMPVVTPAGGTWRENATPVTGVLPTRTTRECDALAVPPLLVPVEGRPGKVAASVEDPMRTQTARRETGLAHLPFIIPMRGGGDKEKARPIDEPMHTVTAGGNHHGVAGVDGLFNPTAMLMRNNTPRGDGGHLSTPVTEPARTLTASGKQALVTWQDLLVPYNGRGNARPVTDPAGAFTTKDRWALAQTPDTVDINEVRFRMLEPHEVQHGMAFRQEYIILGNRRDKVRQLGNAVTPPVAELIVSALVEMILGEELERGWKTFGLAA